MFDFLTPKEHKRARLQRNKARGKAAEDETMASYRVLGGYQVKRTGRGHDFKATRQDVFTGKKETKYVEVKSGNAQLSKLQKKTKGKKGNYVVERRDPLFY